MAGKDKFRHRIASIVEQWKVSGNVGRSLYEETLKELIKWKTEAGLIGLWDIEPLMLSATLDDAWGHGVSIINRFAEAVGIRVIDLGLCVPAEKIIGACKKYQPDLLGLTVLQFDSEDDLILIRQGLPVKTRVIAGGPVFKADDDLAQRTGVYAIAHAGKFLEFVLSYLPGVDSSI